MEKVDFKSKSVCCVDWGMYPFVAQKLAESFGKVMFFNDWCSPFPGCEPLLVGEGFDNVFRVRDFWEEARDCDLFVFSDIYQSGLQLELVRQGKRVWGPRKGEQLETKRWTTKKLLPELGLLEPPGDLIVGLKNLRSFLKDHDDRYVKISGLRGAMETWHHINYNISELHLVEIEKEFGAISESMKFIVDEPIPDAIEVGFDGWIIDGRTPEIASFGIEAKDKGLVSCIRPYAEFPEPIKEVMDKLGPAMADFQYRGFCCVEMRVNDKGPYMIDFAARCGSPSSEALIEVFGNWPEIIWRGAEGRLVKPEQLANFSVEVVIKSGVSDDAWQVVEIENDARQFIKLHNHARLDGRDVIVVQDFPCPEIGAVIGLGDTLQEAVAHLKENCKGIKGDKLEINCDQVDDIMEEVEKAAKVGVDFKIDNPVQS